MTTSRKKRMLWIRWGAGIALSAAFIFLALHKADPARAIGVIGDVRKYPLLIAFIVMCAGDALRALRWKILLFPLKKIRTVDCFSSLVISYAVNAMLPLRLGELLRAGILGKKYRISSGSVFATVVLERFLDFGMIAVFVVLVWFVFPLPAWFKRTSWILLFSLIFICFLLFLARKNIPSVENHVFLPHNRMPAALVSRMRSLISSFLQGFHRLAKPSDYVLVILLSIAVWACNWISMLFALDALDLRLPWFAPLLLVVFVSLSFAIPSFPGYLGTFHWVCQAGLGLFHVNATTALGFAAVLHLLNVIPYLFAGLVFAWIEGVNVFHLRDYVHSDEGSFSR